VSALLAIFPVLFCLIPENDGICESPKLLKGIELYKQESYEEAVELLIEARKDDPSSSAAAFFLGLTYKQMMDYPKAAENLQAAVTLTPKIKEALVKFIDVLIQLDRVEEAEKWISVAEREQIFPDKVTFLKGLYFQKAQKDAEAIEAFEKAKEMDPSFTQAADFQIALIYVRQRKLDLAKERFRTVYLKDPLTDLGAFAREYQNLVDARMFLERPLRFSVGVFGQYDTNLVLKPDDAVFAGGVTGEQVWTMVTSFRADFVPRLTGPWLFTGQYAFLSNVHNKFTHTHDSLGNTVSITPGYDFGDFSLSLAATYSHALLRNPSYKEHLGYLNAGPLLRAPIGQDKLLDLYFGYIHKEFHQPALIDDEDRDSQGINSYASFYWFFVQGAFLNLRYDLFNENTDGANWAYLGHRFALNVSYPIIEKVSLQLYGEAFIQDYKNTNTIFKVKREDRTYTGSIGLVWEFYKHANILVQYNHTKADSNIGLYDYTRDLVTCGVEYRF